MPYNHTQTGHLMIIVLFSMAVLYGGILFVSFDPLMLFFLLLILVIVGSFTTLDIMIDQDYLKIKFGYGLFRKSFALKEISSAKYVRHKWYHGWGIRYWPGLWIYNISGFDEIEIKTKKGKTYRIGTDEPKKLEAAIKQTLKA